MDISFDEIDLRILTRMQENARVSNSDLAKEVNMAPSAVLERVKKLEQKGAIKGYTTQLDPVVLGKKLVAFIFIKSKEGFACSNPKVTQLLANIPEVQEVHSVAGDDCFLVKIRTEDAASLMKLMRESLQKIPGIMSTKTTIVLETIKEQQQIVI